MYATFKPDRKLMGPLPETFKPTISLMTAYGLCQTLSMGKESQIQGLFPKALSYKGIRNMKRIFVFAHLIIYILFMNEFCVL